MEWEDPLKVGLKMCNSIISLKKWKKYPKSLKKQNKMLYIISNKTGLCREIKKIRAEASKKTSVSPSEDWDSDSSLASNSS